MSNEREDQSSRNLLTWRNIRDVAVVALILIVAWKVLNADLKIDISEFSFSDLLALFLALFSVWLSVMFYFKADEGSGRFYDNSYKFTRDMSEILGRIEAGFGERLRHLDEGYSGMLQRFDRLPTKVEEKVEHAEQVIEDTQLDQKHVIEDLMNRAQMAEADKHAVFEKLQQNNLELERARAELRSLERHIRQTTPSGQSRHSSRFRSARDIWNIVAKSVTGDGPLTSAANEALRAELQSLPPNIIERWKEDGLIGENYRLTQVGAMMLRQLRGESNLGTE